MSTKMVQIRDVPTEVVDELKARAAARGVSLSDYLRGEVERIAGQPSIDEILELLSSRPRRVLGASGADLVHAGRDDLWGDGTHLSGSRPG